MRRTTSAALGLGQGGVQAFLALGGAFESGLVFFDMAGKDTDRRTFTPYATEFARVYQTIDRLFATRQGRLLSRPSNAEFYYRFIRHIAPVAGGSLSICDFQQYVGVTRAVERAPASQILAAQFCYLLGRQL